jgi:protein arginine kinase activator
VRYTEIDAGRVTKRWLCRSCAAERGLLDEGAKTVVVLQQMLQDQTPSSRRAGKNDPATSATCPGCGMTLDGFRKQGRLGCARCYATFHLTLAPLLRKLHGATRHVGKVPREDGHAAELRRRVDVLRAELERAVRGEEYERAARLRDEIHAVEAEQSVTSSRTMPAGPDPEGLP